MFLVWVVFAVVTGTTIGFFERIHGNAFAVSKSTIKYVALFTLFSFFFFFSALT
jgi:hypothetical protein